MSGHSGCSSSSRSERTESWAKGSATNREEIGPPLFTDNLSESGAGGALVPRDAARICAVACLLVLAAVQPAIAQTGTACFPAAGTPSVEFVTLLNQWRLGEGLAPLAPDLRLGTSAQLHSQDMFDHNFIGHDGSDGSTFFQRILAQGYESPAGEVVGFGYTTARAYLDGLLGDPPHRSLLAGTNIRNLGVGLVDRYWTVDFGSSVAGPACGEPQLAQVEPLTVSVDHVLTRTLTATDAEGDALVFSSSGLPSFAGLVDHGDGSATLSLAPASADIGTYTFTVRVSDGTLTASRTVSVAVIANQAPILASIGTFYVADGASTSFTLSASDPDGDAVTLTASGLPAFATFNDDGSGSGTLAFSPPPGTAGTFGGISVTASDGRLETTVSVVIVVIIRMAACFPAAGTPSVEFVTLLNQWRLGEGLAPLAPDLQLGTSAQLHSQDMFDHNFIGHDGSDGSTFFQRILAHGYESPAGEVVGFGYTTARAYLDGLLGDPPHRSLLAGTNIRNLGVGLVDRYWTVDFGSSAAGPSCVSTADTTAPTAHPTQYPDANGEGWNNHDVTVSWNWSDESGGSGIDYNTCTLDSTSTGEDGPITLNAVCSDLVGNTGHGSHTVNVDKTNPTISVGASMTDGSVYTADAWTNQTVTLVFTCADLGGSKVATCPANAVFDSDGVTASASGTAADRAGNSASASFGPIRVDKTLPVVSLVGGPMDGGSYYLGSVPAAPACSASDALSGLSDNCTVSGYGTTVGPHTVTATVIDGAGNQNSASVTYGVLPWRLEGFYQPTDMGGVVNTVRNGSTVPLKFEIFAGDAELTSTSIVSQPLRAVEALCSGGPADDIELLATGATSLRYDATAGVFIYNWQTPRKPGYCYVVTVALVDGTAISANFTLR